MTKTKRVTTIAHIAVSVVLITAPAWAQEKLEGKVVGTKLTHCDMNVKVGGCAGNLTLQRQVDGRKEETTIEVPLGTHIKRGDETIYLPALRGKNVVVTHVTEKKERVAKAIEVK